MGKRPFYMAIDKNRHGVMVYTLSLKSYHLNHSSFSRSVPPSIPRVLAHPRSRSYGASPLGRACPLMHSCSPSGRRASGQSPGAIGQAGRGSGADEDVLGVPQLDLVPLV